MGSFFVIDKPEGWISELLATGPLAPAQARAYRLGMIVTVVVTTLITMLDTVDGFWGAYENAARIVEILTVVVMGADYALRIVQARTGSATLAYLVSPYGICDFLAVVPFVVGKMLELPADGNIVFGLMGFLKLARYSPALETLGVVVLQEIRPLASALFIMLLLALSASTALYFAERGVNPQGFGNIPQAMWWAIVTLATLGYGDVVPTTPLGKVMGAATAVLGLCMFALPASILASGFAEEMRRRSFLSTWALVAKVPFFTKLAAQQIAEIASLLRLYRSIKDEVLVREGEMGECMYFIVSGVVEVTAKHGKFVLRDGEFFGEIALLQQGPRTATVKAMTRCQLLILDARDFNRFVEHYPHLMEAIAETARQRLGEQAAERR
ncbi:MAG: cyclic nucleotide-gated ion channel/potassium channel family protein [Magnetospirillum sp. WYHS-4]